MTGPAYVINDLTHIPVYWLESETTAVNNFVLDSMRGVVWNSVYTADPLNALDNTAPTGTDTLTKLGGGKNRLPYMWGHYDFEADGAGAPSQCKKKIKVQAPITAVTQLPIDSVNWILTSFIGGRFERLRSTY